MRKSVITVLASAIVAGLTAFGVVKACTPKLISEGEAAKRSSQGAS